MTVNPQDGQLVSNDGQVPSPEVAGLFAEAMFWKQKYFELRGHNNQIIDTLLRPAASAEQIAAALGVSPEGVQQ